MGRAGIEPATYGNNSWAIIAVYFDEAAAQTTAKVTGKYLGTMAAVDVFRKRQRVQHL
jgi:hypothetical protein